MELKKNEEETEGNEETESKDGLSGGDGKALVLERGEEGRDVLETFWSAKLACNERIVEALVLIEADSMVSQENDGTGWWWEKDNIGLDTLSVLLLSKTPDLSDKIKSYPHLITSATFSRVWTRSCRRDTHAEYEMKVLLHDLDPKEV